MVSGEAPAVVRPLRRRLGLAGLALCPITLSGYAYGVLSPGFSPANLAGTAVFCAGFALLSVCALAVRRRWLRSGLMVALTAVPVALTFANVLFFRFFGDQLPVDAVLHVADGATVTDAIGKLLTLPDLVFVVFAPAGCALLALGFRPLRPARSAGVLAGVLVSALTANALLPRPGEASDPSVRFLEEGIAALIRHRFVFPARLEQLAPERERLFPPAVGERYAPAERGIFLQEPLEPTRAPLREPLNVVLLVLESFRAYESGLYGHAPSFTPGLDELGKDSLVFDRFYATGFQTVRGEFALLAAHPDQLWYSPFFQSRTDARLITLPMILHGFNYYTSWVCASDSHFHCMREFQGAHGVDHFHDYFDPEFHGKPILGWGVNDRDGLTGLLHILGRQPEPFYTEFLSVSSHFPFADYGVAGEAPAAEGTESYRRYTQGLWYVDRALTEFFRAARSQPWFGRTLFVITGDHGLALYPGAPELSRAQEVELHFRLPLVIHAPGRVAPGRVDTLGGQMDVAPTILDLLGLRVPHTFAGRSLLDRSIPAQDRYALLLQQNHWYGRIGDVYLYGAAPDQPSRREELYPYEGFRAGDSGIVADLAFRTAEDLLQRNALHATVLPDAEAARARRTLLDRLELSNCAVRLNRALAEPGR